MKKSIDINLSELTLDELRDLRKELDEEIAIVESGSVRFGFKYKNADSSISIESNVDDYGILSDEAIGEDLPIYISVTYSNSEGFIGLPLEQVEKMVEELTKAIDFLKE